jgi:translocation and assembly module TamB
MEMLQDKLYLRSCMLEGFSTYFVCKNDQSVEGFVNLSLLRTFFDFFARSEGQAYVKLKSKGSITDFNFDGAVNVTNGILNFKGFPTLMENVQVNALVRGNRIIVNQFNLTAGDGGGSGKGEMLIGNHWDSILFDLLADVKDLPVRVPEDFPANVTGRVTFTGPGSDSKLQGDAKINSLHYTKRFDWRSKLLEFGGKNNRMVNTSLIKTTSNNGHGVNFDLHFTAAEPVVTLKNNITDVAMTSNFSLVGKFPNVALLGTLNVSTGRFEFRNQIFNIDSGTIDFRSLHSYEPSFVDIYASTRVQEYNVNLNIRTVNDAYRVDMTSTPPLSETDLLSLLTVGTVTNSYANFSTQQSGLTQGVAVGIVSGGLQDKLERIGLLDTFQVIPDYSQISKSTQLRLMVGKDLAKDVGLIYSTDLYNAGTNQEMRLKQTVNKNFSLSGTVKNSEPNQNVDLGVDFEFGFDF